MNNLQPKISVIIPCFNAEKHLEEAVRSIMRQTHRNLEIICINDGSTDGTLSILNRLADIDNRILVIDNYANIKLIQTLNKGISIANGDYIARMDADDISSPERLTEQLLFLQKNNLDICGTYVDYIKENGDFHSHCTHFITKNAPLCFVSMFETPLVHPSILCKSNILKHNNFIESEESYVAEDYYLWCNLLQRGIKMGVIPKYHLKYRINNKGESISRRDLQYKNHFKISHRQQLFFVKTTIDSHVKNLILGRNIGIVTYKDAILAISEIKRLKLLYLSTHVLDSNEINEIKQWTMCRELYILFQSLIHSNNPNRLFLFVKLVSKLHYLFSRRVLKSALFRFMWVINTIR